ncbi:MAG: hypothetical protein WHU10_01940 [Fimbriimonadales bacterium]
MKRFANALVLALSLAPAASQAQTTARLWLESALTNLRGLNRIAVRQAGMEVFGQRERTFLNELWLDLADGGREPRLEAREWVDGTLQRRTIGDGRTLWVYEPARKRYSAWNYGGYSEDPAANALQRMLLGFRYRAGGPLGWIARLLDETWARDGSRWTPWIPQALEEVGAGGVSVRSSDQTRGFSFLLTGGPSAGVLTAIRFAEQQRLPNGGERRAAWEARIGWTEPPADAFHFVPEKGAVPVVWQAPRTQ